MMIRVSADTHAKLKLLAEEMVERVAKEQGRDKAHVKAPSANDVIWAMLTALEKAKEDHLALEEAKRSILVLKGNVSDKDLMGLSEHVKPKP